MTLETVQQLSALQKAALPVIGSVHAWMPLKAHAATAVRVLSVTWQHNEFWVEALDLRNTQHIVYKALPVWVVSTVLLDEEAARTAEYNAITQP